MTLGQSLVPVGSFSPSPDEPPASKPINLAWIAGVPLRRWKLVIAVPIVMLLAVAGLLKVLPPVYQATSEILMFDPRLGDLNPGAQQAAERRAYDVIGTNTEIELIKSQAMLRLVTRELQLQDNPEFQPAGAGAGVAGWLHTSGLVAWIGGLFGERTVPPAAATHHDSAAEAALAEDRRIDESAGILRQHLIIERVPLSYILRISARSYDPALAERIVKTLMTDYFADQKKDRQKGLVQMEAWLSAKLAELKARSTETGVAIEKLKAESGVEGNSHESLLDRQISDLNTQLTAAHSDAADKKARIEQIQHAGDGAALGANVPDSASPAIAQLRVQMSILTQQQAELRTKFGENHASVLAITTQIMNVKRAMRDEVERVRADLQNSYELALRREQTLRTEIQKLSDGSNASGDTEKLLELKQLRQAADANAKVYDAYLARYSEIESSKSVIDTNERVISAASLPTDPVFPRHKVFYLMGGGIGAALGLLLAFVVDIATAGITIGSEAEVAFGFPVVGIVPLYRFARRSQQSQSRTLAQTIVNEPFSPLSEAIRSIRVGLRLSNHEENPKVIMVTSPKSGEGKSTLSMLLAASSAAAGHRTILIDCDVRGRAISRDFDDQQRGLTDLLLDRAPLDSVIVRHPDVDCAVMPAGSIIRSPGDLLASPTMRATIARLREQYDYVVIDTPPLLAVVDGLALAAIADKIIMAIDGRKTRPASVADAFRLLRPEAHRIAGIVFNKAEPDQLRQYGTYPYGTDYTYATPEAFKAEGRSVQRKWLGLVHWDTRAGAERTMSQVRTGGGR